MSLGSRPVTAVRAAFLAILLGVASAAPAWAVETITARDAHAAAGDGSAVLIDIRTPEEWREGVPAGAALVSMHGPGFLDELDRLTGGDRDRPIALICATGGRSAWLAGQLEARGYTSVLDVAEGMHGSRAGRGWLASGLPVERPAPSGRPDPGVPSD